MNKIPTGSYIDIRDAAELTGYAIKHLSKLMKAGALRFYKANRRTMVSWQDVQRLASRQKPFWISLPDNALNTDVPDPRLLLYTEPSHELVATSEVGDGTVGDTGSGDAFLPVEYFRDNLVVGNCIEWMRRMPAGIIQCVVTSPPYWGVRSYPGPQEITWADGSCIGFGEEQTVDEYVSHTLEILRHLKRVLSESGTIWWNMGDIYQTRAYLRDSSKARLQAIEGAEGITWKDYPNKRTSSGHAYLKDKDLTLVPFMVALGAERLGFYIRSVVIWYKDNTIPEPVDDRPTTAHEYVLLLAKSREYQYDKAAESEASITGEVIRRISEKSNDDKIPIASIKGHRKTNGKIVYEYGNQRNLRTVWQFPTSSRHGDHTAAFPIELPLRCLRLSTVKGDLVFDPFTGSGTTLAAAKMLGCHYFGCDIAQEWVDEAYRRLEAPAHPLNGTGNGKRAASGSQPTEQLSQLSLEQINKEDPHEDSH